MIGTDPSAPLCRHLPMLPGPSASALSTHPLRVLINDRGCYAPKQVRGVIGSGHPCASALHIGNAWQLSASAGKHEVEDWPQRELLKTSPSVPGAAIFSCSDCIVAPQCSIEHEDHIPQSIEIASGQCDIGDNPVALQIISDHLAQPEGQWPKVERGGPRCPIYLSGPLPAPRRRRQITH